MKKYIILLLAGFIGTMVSCTKDTNDDTTMSTASLSSMSTSSDLSVVRVKNSDNGKWNIKMNAIASAAYAKSCSNFPLNSLIVKEKLDAAGNMTGYATMFRTSGDPNSANGWVWTEYASDGHVIYDASNKGVACQSCHAQSAGKKF